VKKNNRGQKKKPPRHRRGGNKHRAPKIKVYVGSCDGKGRIRGAQSKGKTGGKDLSLGDIRKGGLTKTPIGKKKCQPREEKTWLGGKKTQPKTKEKQ